VKRIIVGSILLGLWTFIFFLIILIINSNNHSVADLVVASVISLAFYALLALMIWAGAMAVKDSKLKRN
jgi:ABC-type transport system involved in multi-copper enzyme maturation permease subunit